MVGALFHIGSRQDPVADRFIFGNIVCRFPVSAVVLTGATSGPHKAVFGMKRSS